MSEGPLLMQHVSLRPLSAVKQGAPERGQASTGQAFRAAAGSKEAGYIGASMQKDMQFRTAVEDLVKDVRQGDTDSAPPAETGAVARQWSLAPSRGARTRSGRGAASAGTLIASQGQANTAHGVQVA